MKNHLYLLLPALALQACSTKKENQPEPDIQTQVDTIKRFTIGVIEEIQSNVLNEKRTLNVYLPEGYDTSHTTAYPVIYLLDGGADEDFIHVAGLVQYSSFPWINDIPPSIVVGIANTDRKRDFTYPSTIESQRKEYPTTGHSDKFISFIESELQPFIEKKFRTLPQKTLIGQSLGGLVATEILLKKPALFDTYIIVSPSLWWDNGSLLKPGATTLLKEVAQPISVHISVGKEGLTPGEPVRVMEDDAKLLSERLKSVGNKNLKIGFDYLPKENHATIGHQAMMNAFRWLHPEVEKK